MVEKTSILQLQRRFKAFKSSVSYALANLECEIVDVHDNLYDGVFDFTLRVSSALTDYHFKRLLKGSRGSVIYGCLDGCLRFHVYF